jgi:hypothetical protein
VSTFSALLKNIRPRSDVALALAISHDHYPVARTDKDILPVFAGGAQVIVAVWPVHPPPHEFVVVQLISKSLLLLAVDAILD